MTRRWLHGLLLVAALAAPAAAQQPTLPAPRGLVNDFAGVIDPATEARLDARLTALRRQTGAELVVVTVDTTGDEAIFDYGMRLVERWRPGSAERDDGVLFLTAVRDRRLHIFTGYGAEGILPDGLVGEIRDRHVVPHFRRGDYAAGVVAGSEAIASVIADARGVALEGTPATAPAPRRRGVPVLAPLVLFALLSLLLVSQRLGFLPFFLPPIGHRGGFGRGFGGGGFGGAGGGFGGFGGGGFGGGGAGGRW